MATLDEYEATVREYEDEAARLPEAGTFGDSTRELLGVAAGGFARRLRSALWTSSSARERAEGLATRLDVVQTKAFRGTSLDSTP